VTRLLLVALAVVVGACTNPAEPVPCTLARATEVDTLGWSIRANGDTVGPMLAWTCDPRIHFARTP